METSWTQTEEALITETMALDGIGRMAAIRRLRSSWLIGETPPPTSRPGRRMPRENPRYGQPVGDTTQNRSDAPARASFLGGEASTRSGKGLSPISDKASTKSVRKAASARQARWRAKRAGQMPEQIAA